MIDQDSIDQLNAIAQQIGQESGTLTEDLATYSENVSTNTTNIATNAANIATNITNIATNLTTIQDHETTIQDHEGRVTANETNIDGHEARIATNETNIGTNITKIGINTAQILTHAENIRGNKLELYNYYQKGEDLDGEAAGDESGHSVSLSSDGNVVAIGAWGNDGNGNESGNVRVYEYVNNAWNQRGSDIDGEAAGDQSGYSVSLSSDGNVVAIGAIGNGGSSGQVRVYEYVNNNAWIQRGSDLDGEAASDQSGTSVSLSSDGSVVAIGAIFNDGNGSNSGQVRVYEWKDRITVNMEKINEIITYLGNSGIALIPPSVGSYVPSDSATLLTLLQKSTNLYTYGPRNEWITAITTEESLQWGETGIPDNLNMTVSFWIWPQDYYGQGTNVTEGYNDGSNTNADWANLIQLSEDGENNTQIYIDADDNNLGTTTDFSEEPSNAVATVQVSRSPAIYIGSSAGYTANELRNNPYTGGRNFTTELTPQYVTYVFNTEPGDNSTYPNTKLSLYYNGYLYSSTGYVQSHRATESAFLWIGNSFFPWSSQGGEPALLKNMTFFNRPLSDGEVSVLYERENQGLAWKKNI